MARGGVANVNDIGTGVSNWVQGLPPVTRAYGGLVLLFTILSFTLGVIDLRLIALVWPKVVKRFEIWRLLTNFFILTKPSFKLVIYIMWIASYMIPLEKETYQFEPADYVYMLLFNGTLLNIVGFVIGQYFNGLSLVLSCVYVWSRNFRDGNVSFYGLITIKAFYVPFAFVAINILLGESFIPDIAGIVVGHIYYFFKDLYPITSGRRLLETPHWLKRKCADWGLGRHPVTGPAAAAAAADPGFRAFYGRGQRLGTQ